MITTGATGQPWRASITPWGSIEPWGETPALNWYVAADDRWHVPADEQSVRQQRVEGTAVVETRVRVPSGDVVQRIYSVADVGGLTIVEIFNESPMPVAVAFDRRDLLTERPIVDQPIEGIDLPDESFVLPLGHRASVRVAIAHDTRGAGAIPAGVSSMMQVVRGWSTLTGRASRFGLPDGERGATLAESVTAARCEIALGSIPRADDDAAGFVLALHELVRMGESPDHWLPELVDAVERLGPADTWDADVALDAAAAVLVAAGERRAVGDLRRIASGRTRAIVPSGVPAGVRAVAWLESRLASRGDLLPSGVPTEWLGQSFDVYGVPTGHGSSVSFAVRWHGERPAVLWEQTGDPIELTSSTIAPEWRTADIKGEALWPVPPGVNPSADHTALTDTVGAPADPPDDFASFT